MRSLTLIAFACSACTAHALFGLFRKRVTPVPPRGVAAFAPTEKPIDAVTFLPESTVERASAGNPIEKAKLAKDPMNVFQDWRAYAAAIRAGELDWTDVEKADMNTRLKWVGLVHRDKRTPGRFMMRMRIPNGVVNSALMRHYANSVEPYGPELGVIDITTRQNIQLRGVTLEDSPAIVDGLHALNQTSFHSALDNVRNMVGSPLAGIDAGEMLDTRPYCNALNDLITVDATTGARGNPEFGQLPRKFNIAISGARDDLAHTHINDIGLVPCAHAKTGEMGFNVVIGGYFSIKRVAESIPIDCWIPANVEAVRGLCAAILRVFRDEGARGDRQKARLMWLVEEYGVDAWKARVLDDLATRGTDIDRAALAPIDKSQPPPAEPFERREIIGVHAQPQEGRSRVGVHVPTGRLSVKEARFLADVADEFSDGEIRLTVEQNLILPNVDTEHVPKLLKRLKKAPGGRLSVEPGHIVGHTVSCTGAQFCGLALVETKAPAERIARELDARLSIDKPLRIHWTGCPNSCGQAQVGDIGLMGAPAKKWNEEAGKMKAVPGVNIFVGGQIGEHAHLAEEPYKKGVPMDDEDLLPVLLEIAQEKFGAQLKV